VKSADSAATQMGRIWAFRVLGERNVCWDRLEEPGGALRSARLVACGQARELRHLPGLFLGRSPASMGRTPFVWYMPPAMW
jgi:hypothetical protein